MSSNKSKKNKKVGRYSYELRLRAVKLHLEEGYSINLISEELGVGKSTLSLWLKRYREDEDAGLRAPRGEKGRSSTPKLPLAIKKNS